jgi:hypothetical protein
VNLAANRNSSNTSEKLRTALFEELKRQGDPRVSGQGAIFDQYPYASPAQRNFYERFMRGEKLKAGWVEDSDFEKIATP